MTQSPPPRPQPLPMPSLGPPLGMPGGLPGPRTHAVPSAVRAAPKPSAGICARMTGGLVLATGCFLAYVCLSWLTLFGGAAFVSSQPMIMWTLTIAFFAAVHVKLGLSLLMGRASARIPCMVLFGGYLTIGFLLGANLLTRGLILCVVVLVLLTIDLIATRNS